LASSGHDRTVRIWDANTGECVRVLTEHEEAVEAVRFNPDSSLIASCSQDATIRIWDVKTGDHKKLLRVSRPYEGMNISGVTGLSDAEKALLLSLGAEAT
jgi:WD40 repeat protein